MTELLNNSNFEHVIWLFFNLKIIDSDENYYFDEFSLASTIYNILDLFVENYSNLQNSNILNSIEYSNFNQNCNNCIEKLNVYKNKFKLRGESPTYSGIISNSTQHKQLYDRYINILDDIEHKLNYLIDLSKI